MFELDGVSIMEQVLECTIHYRGDAPSVVEDVYKRQVPFIVSPPLSGPG